MHGLTFERQAMHALLGLTMPEAQAPWSWALNCMHSHGAQRAAQIECRKEAAHHFVEGGATPAEVVLREPTVHGKGVDPTIHQLLQG